MKPGRRDLSAPYRGRSSGWENEDFTRKEALIAPMEWTRDADLKACTEGEARAYLTRVGAGDLAEMLGLT